MEIYFCDICNESVPALDLEEGRAYRRKGRVVCLACDAAMGGGEEDGQAGAQAAVAGPFSVESPPLNMPGSPAGEVQAVAPPGPSSPPSSGAGGVLVGMLAIVFSALGLWTLLDRMETMGTEQRAAQKSLEGDLLESRRVHDVFVAGLGEVLSQAQQEVHVKEAGLRAALAQEVEGLRADLALSVEREAEAAGDLRALRAELEARQAAGLRQLEGFEGSLVEVEKNMLFYKNRVIELEETLRALSAGSGPMAGAGALATPGGVKTWEPLLPDLQHANGGLRLEAVYALGETGDADVVPHLTPMLMDEDLFVRMATARMLDELGVRSAVPALIEALEDAQGAVREAAVVALRNITGQDQGFNPVAQDSDRAKKLEAWRSWWKRNGDDFLTGR